MTTTTPDTNRLRPRRPVSIAAFAAAALALVITDTLTRNSRAPSSVRSADVKPAVGVARTRE
jgi:hypothetical protein